jgi:proteic killer suppression protein
VTARERRRVPCVASNTVNKGLAPRRADMHAAGKYRIDVLRKGSDPQPVIRSFADAETERIWHQQRSRRLPAEIQQRALNKLAMLSHATDLNDLRVPPGNRLEALSGDRAGQHSVRINQQWRICFRWTNGDAHEVEIVDYH